ncbi:MAG: transcription elongation factor GreA [Candidatus Levybacteria bacterium RIFCSPHIGHO2_02_FULL_40_18]|nr:MAG: transcription elongation factor GreA [Candidatus Levybacteria bacterium RIFCSPHIGHO2_01_FULL_40_58]OGH26440.1 MAG: transcription elongation factor GreA [Candidatus Levybacteria bacterium RIFCSPHIGHO2_02_FULL_40_18]OGH31888.1 MAG: transcription elongation factor GreA [Candidatus Levybacteria bacterium RIFCSPHIGHO2_12_FULL_40_31]OGH40521.1 MAG: transcription elongation factor GreA [Candidatus Levybacteria bacterium RIFCSPLOWO2_01_FULL_40_64]OGH49281.1 MAG: transcription elongation factor 
MDAKSVYVTRDGLHELKTELEELNRVKRPEVLERVSQARSMGDLAENSEYTAAREELSLIDGRIEELSEIIKRASLIEGSHKGGKKAMVQLGSVVTLSVNGKKEEFNLVGEWEADPKAKKISHESPLGKALIGKSIGEKVEVEAPAGKVVYTVVSIH